MIYVCLSCYNRFDNDNLKELNEEFTCPMRHCSGAVVELDEMIAPTIIMLNQKGYSTRHCCAGHIDDDNGYIVFDQYDDMDEADYLPSHYPEGTDRHPQEKNNVIRWTFETEQFTGERIKEIGNFHKELFEWADSLEVIE